MDHLSEAQLASLQTKLQTERAQLLGRLEADDQVLASAPEAEPGDIEDAAAEAAGRFAAGSLRTHDRARLAEVEAALERMADGSYGICEDSDDEIPFRRLEIEPTTRYTVAAQEQRERERGVRDRHDDDPQVY